MSQSRYEKACLLAEMLLNEDDENPQVKSLKLQIENLDRQLETLDKQKETLLEKKANLKLQLAKFGIDTDTENKQK